MPIYEYQCQSCGQRTEAMQRVSDPPLETCEECGGDLRKLLSAPAFQFKGSGWYVTDYARKGGGADKDDKGAKADGKEGSSKEGSSDAKSGGGASDTKASGTKASGAAKGSGD